MKIKTATIEDYLSGEVPLPPTFTTGYKHDLAVAREMIRRDRRNDRQKKADDVTADTPVPSLRHRLLPT